MKGLKLRCYVCGKDIIPQYEVVLISPSPNEVDRVFVAHGGDCLEDISEDHPHLVVYAKKS
jgi:hypothetical protein